MQFTRNLNFYAEVELKFLVKCVNCYAEVKLKLIYYMHALYYLVRRSSSFILRGTLCTEKSTSVQYAEKSALVAVAAFICPQKAAEVEL